MRVRLSVCLCLSVNQFISVNWLGVAAWKTYGHNGFLSDVTKSDYNFCPADISAGNPRFRSAGGIFFSKNGPKEFFLRH